MENNDQIQSKVINVEISKEMKKSYIDYAMSVIVGRALPDVRDGMKPVHRRILYTMHEAGLTPDKAYRKCADTVGSVLGKYHPHGDASVYDALVRMAQDFSLRYPIIDGHGNFGSIDGDSPAAYRYTEARMSKISQYMLQDIDKETVDYMPNYDDRLEEPTVLPSRIPNLLINGSSGIAVGMATNIPPHNITEVINGVVAYIDNHEITIDELMEHIKGPDFPTAGLIMGKSGIRSAYHTGRGKITMRARAEIEETKNGKMQIIVTELPYQVNKARVHMHIAELIKEKRLEGAVDVNDYSDRDGIRLVVDIKQGANANVVLNHLFKLTQLQETFGVINLALVDGRPMTLDLKSMISEYVKHQVEVIVRRCIYDKKKAEARAHILEGYRIALDNIDEVIRIIRESYDSAKENLIKAFGFSDIQAQAILDMQLKRLQGLEREKIDEEYNKLLELIEYLESVLASEEKQYQVVKDEIIAIRDKVGDERRTEIVPISDEIDDEDLIPEEECVITLTQFGYIKRTTVDTYKVQNRGGRGVSGLATREEDFVKYMFTGSSHAYIMLFTDLGRVYNIRAFEVPESGRNSKGMNIVNLLELQENEKVTALVPIPKDVNRENFLTMVTRSGTIKRTQFSAYITRRKGGVQGINLDDGDELIAVELTSGDDDILLATNKGMGIRFAEKELRPIGRVGRGVRGIRLRADDFVVGMAKGEEGNILIVSENGYGKQTPISDYRKQSRGGYGTKTYRISEETGNVVQTMMINEQNDIMLITSEGVIIRIDSAQIRNVGRVSKGVRLVRLSENVKVISAAKIDKDMEKGDEIDENI